MYLILGCSRIALSMYKGSRLPVGERVCCDVLFLSTPDCMKYCSVLPGGVLVANDEQSSFVLSLLSRSVSWHDGCDGQCEFLLYRLPP